VTDDRPRRSAIVTGSSRGIGAAVAAHLVGRGWQVTLHGRDERRLVEVQRSLGAGAATACFAGDLGEDGIARQLVASHLEHFGALDALVVNAGMAEAAWLSGLTDDSVRDQLEVNLLSSFSLVSAAVDALADSPYCGRIMLMSSITADVPIKKLAVYSAAKAALVSLSRSINLEYGRRNVRATALLPGYVATDLASQGVVADAEHMMSADDIGSVVGLLLEAPSGVIVSECRLMRPISPLYEV